MPTIRKRFSRREALGLIGAGTAGIVAACGGTGSSPPSASSSVAPMPEAAARSGGEIIRTILRDMSPDELADGATLFHEHMSLTNEFWIQLDLERLIDPSRPYFMQNLDFMIAEMQAAADDGIACIVDGGHTDMGRSVDFLRTLSERSAMPIVASGGYYHEPTYPPELSGRSEDELLDELVRDTQVERWGAYGEIGYSAESTADEQKVLRAVGRAHLQTNLPIFTHTANGKEAVEQLDLLESVGVDPSRVTIGHLGYPDVEVHEAICARGAYVGFDRLGGNRDADAAQVPMVVQLLEAGYTDNVLLASDFAMERETRGRGGAGYGKTLTRFVPFLREAGVGEDVLRRLTSDNPRRFLAFVPRGV